MYKAFHEIRAFILQLLLEAVKGRSLKMNTADKVEKKTFKIENTLNDFIYSCNRVLK